MADGVVPTKLPSISISAFAGIEDTEILFAEVAPINLISNGILNASDRARGTQDQVEPIQQDRKFLTAWNLLPRPGRSGKKLAGNIER